MSSNADPLPLLEGGSIDGGPPSQEMLELLGVLRSATPDAGRLAAVHAGALGRRSWGRWLLVIALALGAAGAVAHPNALGPVRASAASAVLEGAVSERELAADVAAADVTAADAAAADAAAADAAPSVTIADVTAATVATTTVAPTTVATTSVTAADVTATVVIATGVAATDVAARATTSSEEPPAPRAPAAAPLLDAASLLGDALAMDAPAEAPPSELYAAALAEYGRGCCDCALGPLGRVIEGSTDDAPRAVRRAELLLGVCLARLGWDQSALSILDGIAQTGGEHPYFSEALAQLARLAPRLPDPSVLVSSFRRDDEARVRDEDDELAAAAARYLLGRARYDEGDLEAASRLFSAVATDSPFFRAARFYEGLSAVRLRRARVAETAFRAVIEASPEGDRHRDLATLALARLYYSAAEAAGRASEGPGGANDDAEGALLAQALEAWRRVPLSSEHFLDAFFEESWALYLAGEEERALGHVFGLLSPFFESTEHPEAWVVRGTIHFEHCLYDEAEEDVRAFHDRYDAVLASLDTLVELDDEAAIALHATRAAALGGPTRALVATSILDRDSERRSAHVRAIESELARLGSAPFADGSLGARLEQELGVSAALGRTRLADGVRARLESAREALRERMNEIDRIALETATARREVLLGEAVLSEESSHAREVIADLGVEVWPFDGEYWADEVTSYREVVRDRCGR